MDFNIIGRIAPKHILINTITANAVVIAIVPAMGVQNKIAGINPATDNTALSANAI